MGRPDKQQDKTEGRPGHQDQGGLRTSLDGISLRQRAKPPAHASGINMWYLPMSLSSNEGAVTSVRRFLQAAGVKP